MVPVPWFNHNPDAGRVVLGAHHPKALDEVAQHPGERFNVAMLRLGGLECCRDSVLAKAPNDPPVCNAPNDHEHVTLPCS